jgi:hypothetical protein
MEGQGILAMSDFAIRGVEMHSRSRFQTGSWRWKSIDRVLGIMERHDLNALIFHQVDLTDWLVLPRAYFSPETMRTRYPARLAQVENARSHIREVVRRAAEKGVGFYLEVKEMWYPDELIELHPEVMEVKGVVCPTHPFWWDFIRAKYTELVEEVPGIAGVIMSPGSRESKLTLAVRNCPCERCRSYDPAAWYASIIRSTYEPLKARGKALAIRDFAFSRTDQNFILNACSAVSGDVIMAMKNTPHDYYPTFPDNPRIGRANGHPQWIEFDCWGQYFGMGFFPVSVVEDMQRRLRHGKASGADGVWFRTDLEVINDQSVFNSFDTLNLMGGALLSTQIEQDLDHVYRAWLGFGIPDPLKSESEQGSPAPVAAEHLGQFRDFMKASWAVMEGTLYVRGLVFTEGSCQFPVSVDRAFSNMLVFQGREDWEPGANRRVEPTEENIRIIFAEKQRAMEEVKRLPDILKIDQTSLPDELKAAVRTMLDLYAFYVRGYCLCTFGCILTRKAEKTRTPADIAAASAAADALVAYREEVVRRFAGTYYTDHVYWLFEVGHLDTLIADIRGKLAAHP